MAAAAEVIYEREEVDFFRTVDGIGQKAGVPPEKLRRLVAKELADNALDASDTSNGCQLGELPGGGFYVQDAGPGIPGGSDRIAEMFSFGRAYRSTKAERLPTRGALGNGLRVVAGCVYVSNGTLDVLTGNQRYQVTPQEDGTTFVHPVPEDFPVGTRVEVHLGDKIPADVDCLAWARLALAAAGQGKIYKGNTSAHWYSQEDFHNLFRAARNSTVREVVKRFDGCTGDRSSKIAGAFHNRQASSLTRTEAASLLAACRAKSKPVHYRRFALLGPGAFGGAYAKANGLTHATQASRGLEIPSTVEVWAEVDPKADHDSVTVLVNRTRIAGEVVAYRDGTKTELALYGCGLDDDGYLIKVPRQKLRIVVNVQTPYMGYTTDGKEPNLLPYNGPIEECVRRAAARAQRQAGAGTGGEGRLSQKQIYIEHLDEAIDKASGNRTCRYSQRQLFYAARPFVMETLGIEPNFGTFGRILTQIEAVSDYLPKLYRDSRGVLYHPHLQVEIPLGTLTVEDYRRPAWTFNKILYCEKEGFFPILRDLKWPERNDCALLTSKGYATRAARDVLDLLGETDEEIQFFCVHDADAYGTMIYQTLQKATLARPGRKFQVIDLGLNPDVAIRMRLQIERVKKGKSRKPVGRHIAPELAEWLQTNRVELNAMTTPQFVAWLDDSMAPYSRGKLIPPPAVLKARLREETKQALRQQIIDEVLREADIDGKTAAALAERGPKLKKAEKALLAKVEAELSAQPDEWWPDPVKRAAGQVAS